MSYKLVIAEKPSVAQSIAKVIGADKREDRYLEASDEEFDTEEVRKLVKRLDELDPIPLPWKSDEEALKDF